MTLRFCNKTKFILKIKRSTPKFRKNNNNKNNNDGDNDDDNDNDNDNDDNLISRVLHCDKTLWSFENTREM